MRKNSAARLPQPAGATAMHVSLQALASELSAAQETVLDLQISMSTILASLGDTPCEVIFNLQDMDRLAQILADLSTFTQALAASSPEAWHMDVHVVAHRLNLHSLAHRLCGEEVIPADSCASTIEGDSCILF